MLSKDFNKSFRLTDFKDFRVLNYGEIKKVESTGIKIYYKKNQLESNFTRIGFRISRKVGNAVLRNKIKRITREFFRNSNYKYLGVDILIVVLSKLNRGKIEYLFENSLGKIFVRLKI